MTDGEGYGFTRIESAGYDWGDDVGLVCVIEYDTHFPIREYRSKTPIEGIHRMNAHPRP